MEGESEFKSCGGAEEVICPALELAKDNENVSMEYRVDESYEYYLSNW